jgi:hypothetical protein
MVWLLSLFICLSLLLGILFLMVPELFPTFLTKRWRSHFHHYRQ